jgi:membrane protein YqaA with SNARE-associated domain
MGRILDRVEAFALALGAPGLFLVTFLDSSFLSFPEVTDILLVIMVAEHESRLLLYAGSAVLGSLAGCLALYYVGKRGGEAIVRSRFSTSRVDKAVALIQRYGVMAVIIPSLLPPPAPFKIFVLLAGVARIPTPRFVLAIGIGRSIRYFTEGLLAVWYGDAALELMRTNGRALALATIGVLVVGLAAYLLWTRRKAPSD